MILDGTCMCMCHITIEETGGRTNKCVYTVFTQDGNKPREREEEKKRNTLLFVDSLLALCAGTILRGWEDSNAYIF